jgi:hypothetical protein
VSTDTVAPDIRRSPGGRYPAGPRIAQRVSSGELFSQNAAEFMLSNGRRLGDVNHFIRLGRHVFQFNHPQMVEDILIRDAGRAFEGRTG